MPTDAHNADTARGRTTRASAGGPNLLLILNDDMGFAHIGCYGGEVRAHAGLGVAEMMIACVIRTCV